MGEHSGKILRVKLRCKSKQTKIPFYAETRAVRHPFCLVENDAIYM